MVGTLGEGEHTLCSPPQKTNYVWGPSIIAGIVASYAIIQATLWWIFHIFAIFWRVQFPFHSRYFDNTKRTRYIHVACILVALVLPTIPSITVSVKGGFIMSRFPPIICIGRESDANFYSFIFPITLMYAIGTTVLLAILWRIRRVSIFSVCIRAYITGMKMIVVLYILTAFK